MTIIETDKTVRIENADINLARTFGCGQCFRFEEEKNGVFAGVAYGRLVRMSGAGGSLYISGSRREFEDIWRGFLDLDRDYRAIAAKTQSDAFLSCCAEFGRGIRILRQEPWEALCSFILSQCNNIPRIKSIIRRLCEDFGEPLCEGWYAFPSPERLAGLSENDLSALRAGYRTRYILSAAQAVASGALDLELLRTLPADEARERLTTLPGVGRKVADCVLLYGLSHLEAFPVDTWMKKALREHGMPDLTPFRDSAGVVQQYIFHYMRETSRAG